jgi:4-hydroxybenzoyl-CoA thioesterase/acyl-CoA thioester hydrolase
MAPFTTRRRVEFRDTDAAGIVHFSAFFFWMESVEHELLRAAGVAVMDRGADGVDASWPRVSASCDYLSAVRFGDELEISVSVEAIGRSSVTYAFECAWWRFAA